MENFDLYSAKITNGFCLEKTKLNETVTLMAVYNQFKDNRFKAIECNPNDKDRHIFYDSDVAKWLEACAYALHNQENEEIRGICNKTIDTLCLHQQPNGYFNSFYQTLFPEKIFKERTEHELYCAGHLFEAAFAWKKYQNDDRLLSFSSKFVNYIIKRFIIKKDTSFITPGHEEIELALLRLYSLTKQQKYLKLAEFFLNNRGQTEEAKYKWTDQKYAQSHLPIRKQYSAEGHCVRALYLYTGMADLARIKKDKELQCACGKLFENIANKKMYVTGGLGSTRFGERFTVDYDLPNESSYAETCASVALEFFIDRLMMIKPKAEYGDIFERVFYNGLLSGYSHNGKGFFYENPLEVNLAKTKYTEGVQDAQRLPITQRKEYLGCSCCPPNINRFIERLGEFVFYKKGSTVFINQYFGSSLSRDDLNIEMTSAFPYEGQVKIKVKSRNPITLKLRIPNWCRSFNINAKYSKRAGFAIISNVVNCEIGVNFVFELRKVYSNGEVLENRDRFALIYGPLVMAMEGVDNDFSIHSFVPKDLKNIEIEKGDFFRMKVKGKIAVSPSLYTFDSLKYKDMVGTLVPYFEWANRQENDMKVFF